MKVLKNIGISILVSFVLVLVLTFILTVFNYFDFINNGVFVFFLIFNLIVSIFVGGFIIGKKGNKKGYLEGLKFGFVICFILFLLNYLGFEKSMNLKYVVFNLIVLVCSMFGGMVGISFRSSKK